MLVTAMFVRIRLMNARFARMGIFHPQLSMFVEDAQIVYVRPAEGETDCYASLACQVIIYNHNNAGHAIF
jgi:hypothetical protein